MEIRYTKQAAKALQSYDKVTRQRIRDGIKGLTLSPPIGDIKRLTGFPGEYRLRIGKYRVRYTYTVKQTKDSDAVVTVTNLDVIDIDSRGQIYK